MWRAFCSHPTITSSSWTVPVNRVRKCVHFRWRLLVSFESCVVINFSFGWYCFSITLILTNLSDTKREFRIRWKAPSSGPPGTYNFVWQVKGPRQTGEYAWATQYKVVRDLDLQFTTSPLTSGQAKLSTSLVSVMPVATVALKLFAWVLLPIRYFSRCIFEN